MILIRVSKRCLHRFMISAMLNFRIIGAVFGRTSSTQLFLPKITFTNFMLHPHVRRVLKDVHKCLAGLTLVPRIILPLMYSSTA